MGQNLTGKKIKNTYQWLLHVGATAIGALTKVSLGNGTDSALSISDSAAKVDGDLTVTGAVVNEELDAKLSQIVSNGSSEFASLNAVQGWWSSPLAATYSDQYADATYVGFATRNGDWGILRIDNKTNTHSRTILGHNVIDDHNVPVTLQIPDGRVVAFYAQHANEAKLHYRVSQSANQDDWGEKLEVATSGFATYPCPRIVNGYIQLWYRTGASSAGQWCQRRLQLATSNILREDHWTTEITVYNHEYQTFYEASTVAEQWKVFHYQNPISGTNHDIYYSFIQPTGGILKPGGTQYGNAVSNVGLPVSDTEGLKAVDAGGGNNSTRLLAAGENSDDKPAIIYCRFDKTGDGTDGVYYMGNYHSSSAVFNELSLGSAGLPIDNPASSFYFGGASFNSDNKNIVYVTRESAGVWTLEALTIANDLLSIASTEILKTSGDKLSRPYYNNGRVFVTVFSAYTSYSNWQGDLEWVEV